MEGVRAGGRPVDRLALGIHDRYLTENTVPGVHDKPACLGDFDLYLKMHHSRNRVSGEIRKHSVIKRADKEGYINSHVPDKKL